LDNPGYLVLTLHLVVQHVYIDITSVGGKIYPVVGTYGAPGIAVGKHRAVQVLVRSRRNFYRITPHHYSYTGNAGGGHLRIITIVGFVVDLHQELLIVIGKLMLIGFKRL